MCTPTKICARAHACTHICWQAGIKSSRTETNTQDNIRTQENSALCLSQMETLPWELVHISDLVQPLSQNEIKPVERSRLFPLESF